ncbi:MAG: heterodisulfide reductase-related iron-sulfur binding cluster [Geobacteraceae bacterium]|nr:heterodisulfide reductase-related iron-sulfur binding cluster [Geobacteraceae bacterium]
MEKNELLEWENKCIQEEPPECTASCPIHVDVRLFVKNVGAGDWDAAHKVLNKSMPFLGILGRICDHPCEQNCKRSEVEEPIAIGALERRCVENVQGKRRIQLLPRKDTRIAVLGAGLAGLTTAFELLKKGFAVSLYERSDRLGGFLWEISEDLLPREIIREELAVLEDLKADIRLEASLDAEKFEKICMEYDAVYLDRDAVYEIELPIQHDSDGLVFIDSVTAATSREGVFAGGGTCRSGPYSPVFETLAGKKGALSIERYLQKAKIDHARENEGPFKTRLFTKTEGIAKVPRVQASDARVGLIDEEAIREASRCIQCECMECVKVCLYMERYRAYPKKYAREIFNNEHVLFGSSRTKNLFVNSCTTCGLCETVCPNDFYVGELCLQARRTLHEQKLMPPSFHEFALLDMAHSNGKHFTVCRHEPGKSESAYLYFPSCQLCATSPEEVLSSYLYLQEKLTGGVGIMLRCCGAPAYWAGQDQLFKESVEEIRKEWEQIGKPRVITACSTCASILAGQLPEMAIDSIWKTLEECGLPTGNNSFSAALKGTTISVVDPCITRHAPETRENVRRIVTSLGFALEELPLSGNQAECCGYGGLMYNANPKLADDVISHRVGTAPVSSQTFKSPDGWYRKQLMQNTDTVYYRTAVSEHDYIAYCAMCRDNLAAAGKRTAHLLELIFPNDVGSDPASRGAISWSERRENRALVKENILRGLGEKGKVVSAEHEAIKVLMTAEVFRKIDRRRILKDDIRKVINYAEKTGKKLRNKETGNFLAYYQPENVTFWVEYSVDGDNFRVHNAYCHRMKIVGTKK